MIVSCSCNRDEVNDNGYEVVLPKYSKVSILRSEENNITVFQEKELSLKSIEKLKSISDIKYNNENNIYVFKEIISKGENFNKSIIKILSLSGEKVLQDFYTAEDMKLSPNANYLAYRSFKQDSFDSAEGLKIYDTKMNRPILINNQTLVSGNLYTWLNEDEILYYGASEDKGANIFKYNIKDEKETLYTPPLNGYCKFFIPYEDNILMLLDNGDSNNLMIYSKVDKSLKKLDISFEIIYDGIYNEKQKEIFIIAAENGEEANLFKLSLDDLSLNKVNYDFPKFVDPNGGLAIDNKGFIYYLGYSEDNKLKNDVFIYNEDENSNVLISDEPSYYKIISE
ncbi:hypothetical protein JOC70_000813 [Clostridium pascui]|nr:hypothetical protein [Clostridium pascui]